MQSRFNAPAWALVVVLAAYVPQFFSVASWPPVGVFLFVAFALTVVGFMQERMFGSVIMLIILFVAGPFQMFIVPFMHAASFGHNQQQTALSAQLAAGDSPTPVPVVKDTASSQQAAVRKYPSLAVSNSPMNLAFLARYNLWKQRGDLRLQQTNWPELLADDCASNP